MMQCDAKLAKCEFCHVYVTFLGHVVVQVQIRLMDAKDSAISQFPRPNGKRRFMGFRGIPGYYVMS